MLVDIDKIRANDRIRKDFGNLDELAEDIKENGLINPPVVTPDLQLIAGERRIRACQKLGWKQIEVRVMTVRDAEHQLKLEINENENRKDFTFSEKMEWARRLERIEAAKARERQQAALRQNSGIVSQNSDKRGRSDDIVARETGFGSRDTYRKAKFIVEHGNEELIAKLDAGEISINKAYQELMERLKQEEEARKRAEQQVEELKGQLKRANEQVEVREIVKEVVPERVKKKLEEQEFRLKVLQQSLKEANEKLQQYELRQADDFDAEEARKQREKLQHEADINTLQLRLHYKNFVEKAAITPFLHGAIAAADPAEKRRLEELVDAAQKIIDHTRSALKGRKVVEING